MNKWLKKFSVSPAVVKANEESTLTIKSLDGDFLFFDDVVYDVEFIPQSESDVPLDEGMTLFGFNKGRKVQSVSPVNGELKVSYFFKGEQEWRIHISTKDYKDHTKPYLYEAVKELSSWQIYIDRPKKGVDLYLYSLEEDLYNRRVQRGDLHVHTNVSDGDESPGLVIAGYRKAGFDFLAVTDHYFYHTSEEMEKKLSFMKNFTILPGEEIHNGYAGYYHMVNVGSKYSVCARMLHEREQVRAEIEALADEVEVPEGLEPMEYLGRVWVYREVKKSGGFAILPHVFWSIGYHHVQTKMARAVIENGLCDAYEVLGGCGAEKNILEAGLYQQLRSEGIKVPAVGSSDSHTVMNKKKKKMFDSYSTIAFTEDGDILKAISDGYSVALSTLPGETPQIYGDLRLMMYLQFLMKNYFPLHDELCAASGLMMEEYVHGDESAKEMIEKLEARISALDQRFFGR